MNDVASARALPAREMPLRGKRRCRASAAACRYLLCVTLCVTLSQFITISLSLILGKPIGPTADLPRTNYGTNCVYSVSAIPVPNMRRGHAKDGIE